MDQRLQDFSGPMEEEGWGIHWRFLSDISEDFIRLYFTLVVADVSSLERSFMKQQHSAEWYLYLLECEHNRVYCGVTTEVQRRFQEHVQGTGARFTRANPPLILIGSVKVGSRSLAQKWEIKMKRLQAAKKRELLTYLQQHPEVFKEEALEMSGRKL
jgi:putative endonuclease